MTTRYRCLYEGTSRCAGDQHKRAKCQYCGASMYTMEGQWGVFTWTGDGRYKAADAHRVYSSKTAADRFAGDEVDYVTRWIPA
jgi:hypothetical protein